MPAFLSFLDFAFQKQNLTPTEIQITFGLFSVILITICIISLKVYPCKGDKDAKTDEERTKSKLKERKKLCWCISLVNSFVASIIGVIYLAYSIPRHQDFFTFGPVPSKIFYTVDNLGFISCVWFGLANITDLIFGLLFYRDQLGVLTAYVHHTI